MISQKKPNDPLMSEINITPFVDVMLVLLAIFMITAPLITVGAKVNLPKASERSLAYKSQPIVISLQKSGELYVGKQHVILSTLVQQVHLIAQGKKDRPIYLRADRTVMYQSIIRILSALNKAGYTKVALITLPT